jgi:hypothetical protein
MKAMPKRIICAIIFALSFILSSAINANAQSDTIKLSSDPDFYAITLKKDIPTAEKIMKELLPYKDTKTTGDLMVMAAKKLLGNPYVAGTLEEGDSEDVRVYLSKTDCIIFVETCMNLALTVKKYGKDADFEKLCQMVRQSRYRNGMVRCYSDRIHYTTEWIRQGEKRGILEDITLKCGGQVYDHPIFFMTKNYKKYKHLKDADVENKDCCSNDEEQETCTINQATKDYRTIARVEKELNSQPYTYIPQDKIKANEKSIKSGDIIGYMSTTDGLDIAHVAIAYWRKDGKLGFIHASMGKMKVVVDEKTIAEYANASKYINGIKVIRVK